MNNDKQLFLQNELEDTRPYYNELKRLKELGEMPKRMDELTPKEMRRLWWEECCFDRELANLFDVTINKIKTFRLYKLNIKEHYMLRMDQMCLKEGREYIMDIFDTTLKSIIKLFK